MLVLHEVLARGCTLKAAGLCKQLQLTFVHGLSFTGLTVSVLCVSRSRPDCQVIIESDSEKHAGALSLRSVPASEQEILRPKKLRVELCSAIRIALMWRFYKSAWHHRERAPQCPDSIYTSIYAIYILSAQAPRARPGMEAAARQRQQSYDDG